MIDGARVPGHPRPFFYPEQRATMTESIDPRTAALFQPFHWQKLQLANRIVMAPMTRNLSPGRVPDAAVAAYYRRRAEGGVGLIITEGTYVGHAGAGFQPAVPDFSGEAALAGWQQVAQQVHAAGGKIFPQLWHVGLSESPGAAMNEHAVGPSGLARTGEKVREPMTQADIDAVIAAFGQAAADAERLGFDGVEIHGAHGYLIDQFFWANTNLRSDRYGGDFVQRTRFAVEVVQEVRRRVGAAFPVCLRFSQWKLAHYDFKLATTPAELAQFLAPLVDAGVDLFHCSQRRFWEPEYPGSTLNLAGWTRKLSGKAVISVGSVTLDTEFTNSFASAETAGTTGIDELLERLAHDEFDLVAIGRSLIANPDWAHIVERGALAELKPFQRDLLKTLD
jgi:2,4-dienoyl-CoA reductase-like NADH-dependent reductase (Old Yellow Enzyme family)